MNRRARAGAGAYFIGGARVIAVGDDDSADTKRGNFFEIGGRRLYGVDAEISAIVANEMAVKIVAMRFREPRPSENAAQESPGRHTGI